MMANVSKPAKALKRAALTMRLQESIHQELVESAGREGLSVSAEAERRLKLSLESDQQAGDRRISALLRAMVAQTSMIIEIFGPIEKSLDARRRISVAWEESVATFLPVILGDGSTNREIKRLKRQQRHIEREVRRYREAHGLNPLPAVALGDPTGPGSAKGAGKGTPKTAIAGGAVDALEQEYKDRLVAPSDAERQWASLADKIRFLRNASPDQDADSSGERVRLVSAMMAELTPKERQKVVKGLG